jgi:integrase
VTPEKWEGVSDTMTTEYLLEREVGHVLAALMPQNRLIVQLILHNGARIGDVLRLRTEQLQPSFWYVEQKTGKRRRMGIPEPLLAAIKRQAGKEWAFPGRDGKTPKTRQAVWADMKRAQRAFRLPQNIGTHSARKVYAVQLMHKYGDIERVRRNLNHSSTAITAVYVMADQLLEAKLRGKRQV